MNSWQFYSNIDKYKANSISHAGLKSVSNLATGLKNMKNYGYYNKIDNFYGPGKSRYFYSKDEWDAYQNEKNKVYDKAKDDVRKRDEENIKKEMDKYKNVQQAQNARQQEEQKGSRAVKEQYIKKVNDKLDKSYEVYKDVLKVIQESGGNTDAYIRNTILKNMPDGCRFDSDGDIIVNLKKAYPDVYNKKKAIDTEEAKLDFALPMDHDSDNAKQKNGFVMRDQDERKGIKTNIDYERAKLLEEYNEKFYDDLMIAINHVITDNNSQSANAIKNALWEYVNTSDFKDLRGKISNELFKNINYYGVKKPTSSNTQTWNNAKTWDDGSTTLYEDVLKENILKEEKLYEDILKEDILKEATVKPIEVKEIKVKPIKIK